jgi:plastocyanin
MLWAVMLLLAHQPRTHTVEIQGMQFHPAALTVAVGDTVVWVNHDIVPHTATATGRLKFDTGELGQGASGRFVPRHTGRVRYHCTLHPTMEGRLTVH